MTPTLTVYSASAGSGKTYTLVKEYLTIALNHGLPFDRILAVTFTNDAAGEMKERIIRTLRNIAQDPAKEPMAADLMSALAINTLEIQDRAKQLLIKILLNYDKLSVSTIDALFLQIIRSFLLELNLGSSLQPTLDPDITFEEVALQLSEKIGTDDEITRALIDKALDNVKNDKRVDPLSDIISLLNNFRNAELRHAFEQNSDSMLALPPGFWATLVNTMDDYLNIQKTTLKSQVAKLYAVVNEAGASPEDYSGKSRNVLHKIFDPKFADEPSAFSDHLHKIPIDSPGSLFKEKTATHHALANNAKFAHLLRQIADTKLQLSSTGTLFDNIRHNLLYTRLAQRSLSALNHYKKEHQIFFISDAEELVSHLIEDSDVPFIYEKLGNRFQYVMIDEFQDTSANQWKNFKPLIENCLAAGYKCILVGDPKQSLYSWRGGKVDLLVNQVQQDFSSTFQKRTLNTNRRSLQTIINFNNFYFKNAAPYFFGRLNDVLVKYGGKPFDIEPDGTSYFTAVYADVEQEVYHTADKAGQEGYVNIELHPKKSKDDDEEDETGFRRIPELLIEIQDRGFTPDDIALLIAKNRDIDLIREAIEGYLMQHPHEAGRLSIISGSAFLLKEALSVRLIIYALTHAAFPNDRFTKANLDHHISLLQQSLSSSAQRLKALNINELKTSIEQLMLPDAVEHIIQAFHLMALSDELLYLIQFQDIVKSYTDSGSATIYDFLAWWQSESDKIVLNGGDVKGKIRVITIHKSKGLQYPVVILPKADIDLTPHSQNADYFPAATRKLDAYRLNIPFPYLLLKHHPKLLNSEYAENQALFLRDFVLEKLNTLYVAFTRAEKELHLLLRYNPERKSDNESATINQVHFFETWLSQDLPELFTRTCDENNRQKVFFRAGKPLNVKPTAAKTDSADLLLIAPEPLAFMQHQVKPATHFTSVEITTGTNFHHEMAALLSKWKQQNAHHQLIRPLNNNFHTGNKLLQSVILSPAFLSLIAPADDWWIEREIYAGAHGFLRPDLVVIRKDQLHVIDFKTGIKDDKHTAQVQQYLQVVATLTQKPAHGTLMYIDDNGVEMIAVQKEK